MRVTISNINNQMVVEDFITDKSVEDILHQVTKEGYVIYEFSIEKNICKIDVDKDIKYCGSCNRKIEYNETYYTLDNQDEICSESHELYLGDCEGEYYE